MVMTYDVHLVSNDVSTVETMKDIIYALDSLSATFDDVFTRLENKIRIGKTSLVNINLRISACQTKVKAINGSKKPTLVFSTAKFPGSKTYPLYTTVYTDDKLSHTPTLYKNTAGTQYFPADPKKSSIGNNELTVELQAILCRLHQGSNSTVEKIQAVEEKKLGPFPPMVQSIGSLVYFNSSINPYIDYQTLDNLVSLGR
jgi:WAS family protein 1